MNADQVRAMIRRNIRPPRRQADFARDCDCSRAYISDILAGKREPGPKVLRALGLILKRNTQVTYTAK